MPILEIKNLFVEYKSKGWKKQTVHAVNDLTLSINKGEIFSIAGESGCGKSTLLKSISHLTEIKSGEILFNNKPFDKNIRKNIQMVFQSPSLNPKMKIKDILLEPLNINRKDLSKKLKYDRVLKCLENVGLSVNDLEKYPHEFSGGQKQRISIARALILEPEIILADEPVSALDVSIQGQIINLLKKLNQDLGLTILFISHDLNVIRYISDRVAVMYLGEIVEQGLTDEIFTNTLHTYSKALLSASPSYKKEKQILTGELPSQFKLPEGCKFHTRCINCMNKCLNTDSSFKQITDTHFVKCHLY